MTVYGGPGSANANIGTIFNQEIVSLYDTERGFAYVEYTTTNGAKRGYVLLDALTGATPPTLPNIPTYANFTSGSYGVSGLGQSLKYYKIGNGPNVAFAVFAQHGWEDAWAYDGIELVNIANRIMSNLSSSGISSNWTLYIIPYANPDGITNGYTNNGPGRCTVSTSIDMNRCWPANFTPYYTSRNYTGGGPLGAPEAVALRAFIQNNMGIHKKIILDIHGWLNQTYGSAEVAQYFGAQFGFGHSSTYGSGYLETWGKSIGAESCLVELPMPSSSSDIINRDFSGKLTNAIRNMMNGINGNIFTIDEKSFVKNQTYSEHDEEYNNTKQTKDSQWNTMSASDRASKNDRMTSDKNRLREAAIDYRGSYPLGAEALDYYVQNSGGEHKLGDMRTLFTIPNQADLEYLYLNRNIKAAEYFTTGTSSSFGLKNEYDVKVEAGIDELLASQAGDILSATKVDWYIAAHSFKLGNYSTVSRNGNSYSMIVNFNMSDYYDWDDSFIPFVLNANLTDPNSYILETHIRDLHLAGMAKNFESKGTIRVQVNWQKGQTAEQGNVTVLPN